jgi:hypothetical protein
LLNDGLGEADLVRWPHHGADLHGDNDGAIASKLLATARPRFVIISVGTRNRYGHPSTRVVETARQASVVVCTGRTQQCSGLDGRDCAVGRTDAHSTGNVVHEPCGGDIVARLHDPSLEVVRPG